MHHQPEHCPVSPGLQALIFECATSIILYHLDDRAPSESLLLLVNASVHTDTLQKCQSNMELGISFFSKFVCSHSYSRTTSFTHALLTLYSYPNDI